MVNHLTELETTDDGAISIGSLIAYLKKSKEFQEVFKGIEEIEYLRSIAYVSAKAVKDFEDRKVAVDDPRLEDARKPLEHTHSQAEITDLDTYTKDEIETLIIAACTKLKKDIDNLDDSSKVKLKEAINRAKKDNEKVTAELGKRIEKLEKTPKTIIQKADESRIERIEKSNTELLTILNNIIDKAEEDLSKVVTELSAKFEKRVKESKKKIEIIGGPTPYQPLAVKDEGVQITAEAKSLDFTGSGVTATNNNGNVTVNISGGGGSVDSVVAGTNISVDNTDPANPVVSSLSDRYKTTSTTSNAIVSTGPLTFTVDAGLSYTILQEVVIVYDLSNHMHGTVSSYSGTTLIVDIKGKTGSGTYSSWTINLDGTPVDAVTGSGTTNEIAYFVGGQILGSLSTATYPSLTELSYVKGVTSAIQTQIDGKQATLVSGTNIKTINGSSVLGSGDLVISGFDYGKALANHYNAIISY